MYETIDEKLLKHLLYGRVVSDFLITQHIDAQFMLSVRYTGAIAGKEPPHLGEAGHARKPAVENRRAQVVHRADSGSCNQSRAQITPEREPA